MNDLKFFENVDNSKYFGKKVINQNYIHELNKKRLCSENICDCSFHSMLSSSLLSKTTKTYWNAKD
jgi:hypothetical protein